MKTSCKLPFRGRFVQVEVTSNSGDPVDAYAADGYWLDTKQDLTEAELDALADETAGELQDEWRLHQVESAMDHDFDMER